MEWIVPILTILGVLLAIVASAFFSGAEISLISANRLRVQHLVEEGSKQAKRLVNLLADTNRFLTIILIGNNISIVSAAVLLNNFLTHPFVFNWTVEYASIFTTAFLTPLMLVFAEILPKSIFYHFAVEIALVIVPVINFLYYLFFPFILFLRIFTTLLNRLFESDESIAKTVGSKDDLKMLIQQGIEKGWSDDQEKSYVNAVLKFEQTIAREIMIPLVDIDSLPLSMSREQALDKVTSYYYTRWPVYNERVDEIVGYVKTVDLYFSEKDQTLEDLLIKGIFIPETKKISEILFEMRRKKEKMVFVVNEYGGVAGLISYKDLAEEVVGDILEDKEEANISVIKEAEVYEVAGDTDVDDVNEDLDLSIEKEGYETIGGYICYVMGKIPESGERIEDEAVRFTILDADEKTINRIRIEKRNGA